MRSPCVRLSLKGRTLADIPFDGDSLRIGRMKENDVVIHNLSVSRFHATLTREGDKFVIQDSGSENGIYVNGERQTRAQVGPGDQILIGKHELEILPDGSSDLADPSSVASDAWDASNTYFVGVDTQAKMLGGARVAPDDETDGELVEAATDGDEGAESAIVGALEEEPAAESEAVLEPDTLVAEPEEQPDTMLLEPEEAELFGAFDAGDPLPDPTREYDVSAADIEASGAAAVAPDESHSEVETFEVPPSATEVAVPDATPSKTPAGRSYAGLIVSRRGRFERVLRWDAERLCLGRAVECDVVLAAAEVSRNHTLLVRDGDSYEVRDLESINGTWVNGEKILRRKLEVGDVIRVDEFELTFVLEDGPIGDEIVSQAPEELHAVPSNDAQAFTQLGEMLDLAPFDVGDGDQPAVEATAMSFDNPPSGEPDTVVIDGETTDRASEAGPGNENALDEKPESGEVLAFELKIRLEELPEPLREALRTLEDSDLRLPVELSLKVQEG